MEWRVYSTVITAPLIIRSENSSFLTFSKINYIVMAWHSHRARSMCIVLWAAVLLTGRENRYGPCIWA